MKSLPLTIFIIIATILTFFYIATSPNQELYDYFTENKELTSYTEKEAIHLEEVKTLLNLAFSILFITAPLINLKTIKQTGKQLIIIPIILSLTAIISFNNFFIYFHKIFFTTNNWLLPSNSLLIQTYPLSFFYKITLAILITILIEGIILLQTSHSLSHVRPHKKHYI